MDISTDAGCSEDPEPDLDSLDSPMSGEFGRKLRAGALLALGAISGLGLVSCTENQRAKSFGGTMTIEIDEGQKFVDATWKEDELWVLTTEAEEGHEPTKYNFGEKSSFGVMEGTVVFKEHGAD